MQVLRNAKQMEETFRKLEYDMVSGGTDTHLLLLDLRSKVKYWNFTTDPSNAQLLIMIPWNQKIDGGRVERILELANVAANKNTVPGDKSALLPGGLRLGKGHGTPSQ